MNTDFNKPSGPGVNFNIYKEAKVSISVFLIFFLGF